MHEKEIVGGFVSYVHIYIIKFGCVLCSQSTLTITNKQITATNQPTRIRSLAKCMSNKVWADFMHGALPAAIDATNFWHTLKYFFDIFPWIKCTLTEVFSGYMFGLQSMYLIVNLLKLGLITQQIHTIWQTACRVCRLQRNREIGKKERNGIVTLFGSTLIQDGSKDNSLLRSLLLVNRCDTYLKNTPIQEHHYNTWYIKAD